jgi:LPXTG-site transpeptidase (sortase) family protein
MTSVVALANEQSESSNTIGITIVVPRNPVSQPENVEPIAPVATQLYPVHVYENREQGRREIIRVYNLREHENPVNIPREPFERDGFRFELGEIVQREMPVYSTRDHVEVIEINSQTNDLETAIRLLSNTMEYMSDDGYFGILSLDASTIQIESQGTTSSSRTASRTREYPHLSSADTSLVPRTITDGGRTYNLSNVEWRTQNITTVDYTQLPATYTAVATYSRTATSVSTIGYTTTAEYKGSISRIASGRTEFTAHFIGIPIVMPVLNANRISDDADSFGSAMHVEQIHIGGITIETQSAENETALPSENSDAEVDSDEDTKSGRSGEISWLLVIFLLAIFSGIAFCAGKYGKKLLDYIQKPVGLSLFLCLLVMMSFPQNLFAAQLPAYGFGLQGNETALHLDTRGFTHTNGDGQQHFNPLTHDSAYSYQDGEHIGVLTVEKLNRRINIFAGSSLESMNNGGGHFNFTGLNSGNTGIVGHNRGRSNGFFIFVRNLNEGDILTLEAGGVTRSYAVTMVYTVDEMDFSPLLQYGDDRLTLVTCVENQRTLRRIAVAIATD